MKTITKDMHVADVVKEVPQSSDVFRQNRIDFCCGGKIPIEEAAENKFVNVDELLAEIDKIQTSNQQFDGIDPDKLTDEELVRYIQMKHHRFLRDELPALEPYVDRVAKVHGDGQPHLLQIKEIFDNLKVNLMHHQDDEDENVFPKIIRFEQDPSDESRKALNEEMDHLVDEHDDAGQAFKTLRDITNDFTPPESACGTYRVVYDRLQMLEKDTFNHIHLENHVLFDRVRSKLAD
ncbi:iron-sulfur cluster repair di-iron protein [Alkalibacillus salilacus]|uniref:Regulator of cell morphogenesis and NO signaling n=1 Tax=Alkalibacillus salilacus TaxID=284582 RepID=A0ABT9VBG5_9BACI|nr:iron-sulfur cluster repair di-iron protein [Alkalibacillus salilacus]MDQ0158264.1 regulator of cell morphogenesis and NO signaling [Alkalibacillus salilacus]